MELKDPTLCAEAVAKISLHFVTMFNIYHINDSILVNVHVICGFHL